MNIKDKLPQLNLTLGVLCACLVFLTVINIITFGFRFRIDEAAAKEMPLGTEQPVVMDVSLEPLDNYQKLFAAKKLFRPLVKKVTKKAKVLTIDELSRDWILVGVVQQDQPEAIIKNRRTRQTYFVKAGSSVGQLKIESVGDDAIVISYAGAKKTLFIQ